MKHPKNLWKTLVLLIPLALLVQSQVIAQQFYRPVDTLDRTFFFSGVTSNVLQKDQIEFFGYSFLNSFWLGIHESPVESPIKDRLRFTSFVTNIEGYYGFSNSRRWDLGVRFQYTRNRLDNEARSSVTRIFQRDESEENNVDIDKTYAGVTGLGIRLRLVPFPNVPALTLNGGYTISAVKDPEDQRNLAAERDVVDIGITYFIEQNPNTYYYFIGNGAAFLASSTNEEYLYNAGGSFFLVHLFSAQRLVLYPGLSYNLTFKPPSTGDQFLVRTNEQLLAQIGFQYQPTAAFSINTSLAYPFILDTSNLLVEQIRGSYSFVSLGLRVVI